MFIKYKIYLNKKNAEIKINNNLILINKKDDLEFIIYTKKCGIFISKFIEKIINSLDYKCRIVFNINEEDIKNNNTRDNEIYIILFPQTLKLFPQKNKYIIYQLEQVKQSKWIDNTYLNRLKNSLISWDYSIENYNNFDFEIKKKLFIFPIPILKLKEDNNNKFEYDILFVGELNQRRKLILNFLKTKYKILIISNTHYYTDLYNEAKKCKILLNLHFYDNAILETCRINEMLMLNKIIISELPSDKDYFNLELYLHYIIFTDQINNELSNINNLLDKIDLILKNDNLFKLQKKITNCIIDKIYKLSSYFLLNSLKNINLIKNNKKIDYYLEYNINNNKEYKYFNKIAIITSNFYSDNVNYENIKNLNKFYYFDWFCFSKDDNNINNLINFNDIIITNDDNNKKLYNIYSKIKSHNNNIFSKYSHIIWIEPDIFIKNKNFVIDIINLLLNNEDKEYFFCKSEIYDTFEEAYNLNVKTEEEKIKEQLNNYSIEFENKNFTFFNSNFFIIKNNDNTKNILDKWWEEILKYDYENNLSLSLIINKMNLNYSAILKNDIINKEDNQIDYISILNEPIVIFVTSPIIESIAINFSKFFTEFNIKNKIIYDLTEEICINSNINEIYIIIHSDAQHNKLPKIHITYQVEQINSNYFTKKYLEQLDNSIIIWEYSLRNKIKYDKINLNKIFYQPMPFYYDNQIINYFDNDIYDIGFYGATNERRLNIINNLSEKFKTNIGWGKLGNDRDNLINNSKIILNLHYYEDSSLETCRINEILQYDKIIISELPEKNDWYNKELYDNVVIYIDIINKDLSNLEVLINKIKYYLIPENYEKQITIIKENRIKLHNKNKYFLSKNLLNISNILNFNKNKFEFDLIKNELYCLHLIETPYRIKKFKNQEFIPKYTIFPAIKYSPGWIGTCYSYTNIIWNAKRCRLNKITVFEDDCKFNNNFKKKYKIINKFLYKIPKWDIFVGIIANLPNDTKILNIYKYKNTTFLEIDRMLSMVFNIYNKSSYDIILEWDDKNKNVHTNTIDQYLKNKNLSIITTFPFEFSCTDIDSTLWGKNLYKEYNELFKISNNILKKKIDNFSGKIIEIK